MGGECPKWWTEDETDCLADCIDFGGRGLLSLTVWLLGGWHSLLLLVVRMAWRVLTVIYGFVPVLKIGIFLRNGLQNT